MSKHRAEIPAEPFPAPAPAVANLHLQTGLFGYEAACGFTPANLRIRDLLTTRDRALAGCPHCLAGHTLDDRRGCGCPTLENGDMRCHRCGEMVNVRCWNCNTVRGDGWCPNAPEPESQARLAEPGIWGVVAASCVHDDTVRNWTRHPEGDWYTQQGGDDWDSLLDPTLIRDGIAL